MRDSIGWKAGARAVLAAGMILGLGCSGDDEGGGGAGDNPFGNPTAGNGGAGASGGGAASGASGASGAGGGIGGTAVCKHVDLVIAVDGSSSMTEELEAMRSQV